MRRLSTSLAALALVPAGTLALAGPAGAAPSAQEIVAEQQPQTSHVPLSCWHTERTWPDSFPAWDTVTGVHFSGTQCSDGTVRAPGSVFIWYERANPRVCSKSVRKGAYFNLRFYDSGGTVWDPKKWYRKCSNNGKSSWTKDLPKGFRTNIYQNARVRIDFELNIKGHKNPVHKMKWRL